MEQEKERGIVIDYDHSNGKRDSTAKVLLVGGGHMMGKSMLVHELKNKGVEVITLEDPHMKERQAAMETFPIKNYRLNDVDITQTYPSQFKRNIYNNRKKRVISKIRLKNKAARKARRKNRCR